MGDPPYPDLGEKRDWDDDSKLCLLNMKWDCIKEYKFPSRLIGGKARRFSPNWVSEFPWLRYSVVQDAVFCGPCFLFGKSGKETAFRSSPVHDWKNFSAYVRRHALEEMHKTSMVLADNFTDIITGKKESINSQLSSSAKDTVERNRHILREIIETLVLLGQQNIPIRGHTEEKANFNVILKSKARHDLVLADHLANAKVNAKYTSPDVQNEILQICGQQILTKIIADIKSSTFYSIMADEATDSATKEQLAICIRFICKVDNKHEVREEFIGFLTCQSIKGSYLAQIILNHLQDCGLDILKIRGQCYDGAGNMAGKYNGVQALVKERVPLANYIHCKSHSLNLAVIHSSKIQCVRTMMATVQDIAFAFDYSAKRLSAFADELANDAVTKEGLEGRKKLKTLCETRWMSRADSLETFKTAFRVVVHALETLQEDGDVKAGLHLNAILQFPFIISLVASQHIMSNLVGLTAILQKVDMDLVEVIRETKVVMQIFRDEREDPLVWNAIFEEAKDMASEFQIQPSVPRQNIRQQNSANYEIQDPEQYWKVAMYNVFLDHLLQEMDTRILKNEDRFQAHILIPSLVRDIQPEQIDAIYTAYSPDLPVSRQTFENEIRRWLTRWTMAGDRPSTLQEALDKTNADAYPSVYVILTILLTMPATSASCERSFSSMRRIKNYLRSTMTEDRLAALGILHIHRDMTVDIDSVINTFASTKCRHMEFV